MTPARSPFPPASPERWQEAVAKGGSIPPEWTHEIDDGVQVRPLYWEEAAPSAPDGNARAFPLPAGRPRSMPRYEPEDLASLTADLAADVRGGARWFWIRAGRDGPVQTVDDVRSLPLPAEAFLAWEAGGEALPGAAVLDGARQTGGIAWPAIPFHDPLAELAARGSLPRSLEALARETVALARRFPLAVVASTRPYHRAGARPGQEIGFALAAGLAQLRILLEGGIPAPDAASRIGFSIGLGRELFPSLAKLRALRLAWSRVLAAHGIESGATWIHAATSERTLTTRDPWVNLLRATGQAFAATCGGADAVTVACYDEAVRAPSSLGRRLARNTMPILLDECFAGDVRDPGGGSYLVESLTEELARSGWRFLQEIERRGSLATALQSGWVHETLEEAWQRRRSDLESAGRP